MANKTGKEIDILVDIEHDGPIPGEYSMVELGASVIWEPDIEPFHVIIQPLHDHYDLETQKFLDGVGLTREVARNGDLPLRAMERFDFWVNLHTGYGHDRPVFVHFGGKDWSFVDWYFWKFLAHNPFGVSACDLKSMTRGVLKCSWAQTSKSRMPKELRPTLPHTHHAHEDAMEHAERFRKLWDYEK
ncbi:MAG: 3'-5' exonuclease [Patescibacteria group bacterium]